jgi:hypothetical protein
MSLAVLVYFSSDIQFKAQFTNIAMQQGRTAYAVAFRKQSLPPSALFKHAVSPAQAKGNM